jgi:glucose/arabinose dehydrogenase
MRITAGAAALLLFAASAVAQETLRTEKTTITVRPVATGLSHPWGLVFLPGGTMLVTQRAGTLHTVTADGEVSAPIAGVPAVDARGQGGLLGLALHPGFSGNRLVYMSYSEPGPQGTNSTAVARGRLSDDLSRLDDVQVIFSQKPKVASAQHFGSRLVFDRGGRLFVTLGERGAYDIREQAQTLDNHIGKVVRITDDGGVPPDNPFVGRDGALPEIWSIGHRNVQGATLDPATGVLWTIEHGPLGGDELNIPEPGKNYGWPVVSYGTNYDFTPVGSGLSEMPGMEPPLYQWTPVIAPGNMTFYTGAMFPEWQGNLLIAGLRARALVRLELDGRKVTHEERLLRQLGQRIRDVVAREQSAFQA